MTNHGYLLLTPPEPQAIAQLVISPGRRYVQYVNQTYHRTGTLWDSRYKSPLVQADDYLLLCQRYIELNPVRAGMVEYPAHSRWSSYRANGLDQSDPLLTAHPVFIEPGRDEADRRDVYRALFRTELDAEAISDIRMALNQGQPLGGSRFLDSIERVRGQRREVRPRGRPRNHETTESVPVSQLSIDI
jgi:putative transposase